MGTEQSSYRREQGFLSLFCRGSSLQNGWGWKGPGPSSHLEGVARTVSRWLLNISKDGESKTSSGNPCQCSVTLTIVLPTVQICICHEKPETQTRLSEKLNFTPSAPPCQAKAGAETAHGLWSIGKHLWIQGVQWIPLLQIQAHLRDLLLSRKCL